MEDTNILINFFDQHPNLMKYFIMLVVANMILKAVVDSLQAVREQVDKTPDTDDTQFEKFVTFTRLIGVFFSKMAGYFVGIRPNKK